MMAFMPRRQATSSFRHFRRSSFSYRRFVSVFSRLMDGNDKEWHSPSFMSESNISEKEEWLEKLLTTTTTNDTVTTSLVEGTNSHHHQSVMNSAEKAVDVEAFLVVLKALASPECQDAGAPRRADVWMNRLLELHQNYFSKNLQQSQSQAMAQAYQCVIQAWANSDKEQTMVIRNRSERWLNDLIEKSGDSLLSSVTIQRGKDHRSSTVMNNDKPEKYEHDNNERIANQIFSPIVEPSIHCFNAFMDGLTRGRIDKSKRDRQILVDNAEMAEALLRRLHSVHFHRRRNQHQQDKVSGDIDDCGNSVSPNTDTFNFAIRGWTRCKHEPNIHNRVLAIVRLMESYQRENPTSFINNSDIPRPNTKSYSMAMDALISVAKLKARRHHYYSQKMRRIKHNHCINSDHRHREEMQNTSLNGMDEINQATAILKYMHDLYDAGVEGVMPHRVPYNILITGWAALASYNLVNSGYSEEFKAEEILRTMMTHRENGFMEASPDVISYERVMLAWANSRHPNAGKRASWWLKQLWKDYDLHSESNSISSHSHKSSLLPTVQTYNIVMKALAWTDGALAAENVLLDLGEKYRDELTNHPGLCPNSESFAIIIRAWLESAKQARNVDERIASIRRAYEWLSSLRGIENENNLSTAPQLFTGLLSVLKSCAKQRPYVLEFSQQIFEDYRQSRHRLDAYSYSNLLDIGLQAYSGPGKSEIRQEFVENLFAECCDDGLVSNAFIRSIVDDPSDECKNLTDRIILDGIALSWSRNLKNKNTRATPRDIMISSERHALRRRGRK